VIACTQIAIGPIAVDLHRLRLLRERVGQLGRETSCNRDCHVATHRMMLDSVQVGRVINSSHELDCVASVPGSGATADLDG
jgi:hypothetical protein